ncbi:phosphotransferase family protein [Sphingomonas spermidinifaciens]|uniref:Phosphotransferase family protein n=2 Tax=Sphingomonas spermidinifaciens TaxID=1141889 RepID=A0A2A4B690_9SPHN|nr:phosphotransferase family protein [Sphingomonas spermidinifaciens]
MPQSADLDPEALARWIAGALPALGQVEAIEKFAGGQSNPTYRVTTAVGDIVLRRKPFGPLLPSAHAVDREYRLLSALHPTGFPVPRPIALCEDEGVIGAVFYLMEMVEGRTFWNGALPDLPVEARRPHYLSMIDTMAALHSLDPAAIGLADFAPPGNYIERQVARWTRQYRAAQTDEVAEVERLIEWLPQTLPAQDRVSVIHGDYRIDNLIYGEDGRVRAVLDWELATLGDPVADFAYLAMNWAMPCDGRSGLAGLDLAAEGIPTMEEAVAQYCEGTGREGLPNLNWYFAFNLFRLTGIVQGIKKRVIDGNASNAGAAAMAERVVPLAKAAWEQARLAGAS